MKLIKSVCVAAMVLFAVQAGATMSKMDGYAVDSHTGLAWLDATKLNGYGYEDVKAGAGGYFADGWRYAKSSEVYSLLTRYVGEENGGYSGSGSARSNEYFESAERLVLGLGMNLAFNDSRANYNIDWAYPSLHQISTQGIFEDDNDADIRLGLMELTAVYANGNESGFSPNGRWLVRQDYLRPGEYGMHVSNLLVRQAAPIPEPSTEWMTLAGLALIGATLMRKRADS